VTAAVGVGVALVCGGGGYLLAAKMARDAENSLFMSIDLPLGRALTQEADSTTPAMLGPAGPTGGAVSEGDSARFAAGATRQLQTGLGAAPAVAPDRRQDVAGHTRTARPYRKSRDATRAALASPAGAQPPAQQPSRAVAPAPASVGPCTRAVAALGLCASPSNQPRE